MPEIAEGLTVQYTCSMCGVRDRELLCRYRRNDEDVIEWMRQVVIEAVGDDHATISPECEVEEITSVKIPFQAGADGFGLPAKH